MFVIRPVQPQDIDPLERFANSTALGMTSLPKQRKLLAKKIAFSIACFAKEVEKPWNEIYCFVLENVKTGEVGGCSAIYAKTGIEEPVYCYEVETRPSPAPLTLLKPVKLSNGPAELSMLFLQAEWRKERLGGLLSLSRFLFIAEHPKRIETAIWARLRGVIKKEEKESLFWNAVGRHFVDIDFEAVCALQQEEHPDIDPFLPEYPIYAGLLSKQAQRTIGSIHHSTKPALRMLKKEGLLMTPYIDLFDGGPILQAETSSVRTIKKSRRVVVAEIIDGGKEGVEPINSPLYLVSNTRLDYRCCSTQLSMLDNGSVQLPSEAANALSVQVGDPIRCVRLLS